MVDWSNPWVVTIGTGVILMVIKEVAGRLFPRIDDWFRRNAWAQTVVISAIVASVVVWLGSASGERPGPAPVPGDGIPKGAVLAFASTCPQGDQWVDYTDGEGRFLLGVGKGPLPETVSLGKQAGVPTVTLLPAQIPPHSHEVVLAHALFNNTRATDGIPAKTNVAAGEYWSPAEGSHLASSRVDGGSRQAHTNMPPYIAVHFCKKDR